MKLPLSGQYEKRPYGLNLGAEEKSGGVLIADISTQERAGFLGRLLRRSDGSSRLFPQPKAGGPRKLNVENGRLAVASEVRTSDHEDGLALLHIPTGKMFLCNRTGARIWQGIVKGLSPEAISQEISREFGVARAVVQQHTSSFLAELERRGLVTRRIED